MGQPGVNLGSTRGQPGGNLPAPPYRGKACAPCEDARTCREEIQRTQFCKSNEKEARHAGNHRPNFKRTKVAIVGVREIEERDIEMYAFEGILVRRHQALALAPVRTRERRLLVYKEAPVFRPGPVQWRNENVELTCSRGRSPPGSPRSAERTAACRTSPPSTHRSCVANCVGGVSIEESAIYRKRRYRSESPPPVQISKVHQAFALAPVG